MSNLMNVHHKLTMSSLDFLNNIINPARVLSGESEVENRHFIARIEDEIEDLGVAENFYVTTAQGARRSIKGYTLNMEQMPLVGMRESKAVRRQVLEKLKAISNPATDPMTALNDPAFLRGTLLAYTEKVIALEHKVEEIKPDVEAFARIAKPSDGAVCITDAAKALQVQPRKLFNWMQCNNWIYRRAGGKSWLGYQTKVKQQLLEHKVTLIARSDGSEKMVEQVLITPKGLSKLSDEVTTPV